jgi:hypothetical protein
VYSKKLSVLDLPRVFVHYEFYNRDRGDASSSAHRGGPRSNGTYSLVFTHLNVFFNMAILRGATHRVGRALSFSPVVVIGTPPTPHPHASVPPHPLVRGGGGAHSLAK